MAKVTAYGAVEIRRWTKAGGDTLVLTEEPSGRKRLLRKQASGLTFKDCHIPVHRPGPGQANFTERPTIEEAEAYASNWDYESVKPRKQYGRG